MQFSLATIVLSLAALAVAAPQDNELVARQNGNRPVATGTCCVANTSLKQDACNSNNGAGRCVPGGEACKCFQPHFYLGCNTYALWQQLANGDNLEGGGALSCVAQANLACDTSIIERGKSLCRAKAGNGGFVDGAKIIKSLSQAKVN
jgi:hypothetical protein